MMSSGGAGYTISLLLLSNILTAIFMTMFFPRLRDFICAPLKKTTE